MSVGYLMSAGATVASRISLPRFFFLRVFFFWMCLGLLSLSVQILWTRFPRLRRAARLHPLAHRSGPHSAAFNLLVLVCLNIYGRLNVFPQTRTDKKLACCFPACYNVCHKAFLFAGGFVVTCHPTSYHFL